MCRNSFGISKLTRLDLKLYTTYYTSDICVKKQNDLYQSTIGVQFFLQDPASKLESTSQKLGHVSRVAEFFEVSVVRVPLCWLPTISTMKSKPVQVLPSSIQLEDPVLTSTCFYCGLGGQGFHEGTNQHCENFKHLYIPEDDSFRAFMISFCWKKFKNSKKILNSFLVQMIRAYYKDQMKCFCAIGADQYTIVPSITPFIEVDQSVSHMLLMVELV